MCPAIQAGLVPAVCWPVPRQVTSGELKVRNREAAVGVVLIPRR